MQSRSLVLLKNLLRSTSGLNILRYEKDSKKKSKVIGNYIGGAVLFLFLMAFAILVVIGYGYMGLTREIPVLCAILISLMELVFTILKTNGYLFAFKEYDMLMALPFKPSEVAGTKFLYMYIKNLPMVYSLSLAMMIGYGIFAKPAIGIYFLWIILTAFIPLIPMVIASAVGALIAGVGAGFRHKQIIQTVLTFIFILICFSLRFIIEAVVREDKVDDVLNSVSVFTGAFKKFYIPARWFENSILEGNIIYALLFVLVSATVFLGFAAIVGKSYRKINSRLMTGAARKTYKMSQQKKMSVPNAIAFKEFKKFTSSTIYITNMGFGEVLTAICAIAVLFVDMNSVIAAMTNGAPITKDNLIPAIPFVVYFLIGMSPTTAVSMSLEGKNYWILKSLPIEMKEVLKGKLLFNMYLTLPFMALASLTIGIKSGANLGELIMFEVLGFILCAFSSTFGMVCNLGHLSFDWENEIDVVKKGASLGIYILVNMALTTILLFGVVALGFVLPTLAILAIFSLIFAILSFICYKVIEGKKL